MKSALVQAALGCGGLSVLAGARLAQRDLQPRLYDQVRLHGCGRQLQHPSCQDKTVTSSTIVTRADTSQQLLRTRFVAAPLNSSPGNFCSLG